MRPSAGPMSCSACSVRWSRRSMHCSSSCSRGISTRQRWSRALAERESCNIRWRTESSFWRGGLTGWIWPGRVTGHTSKSWITSPAQRGWIFTGSMQDWNCSCRSTWKPCEEHWRSVSPGFGRFLPQCFTAGLISPCSPRRSRKRFWRKESARDRWPRRKRSCPCCGISCGLPDMWGRSRKFCSIWTEGSEQVQARR